MSFLLALPGLAVDLQVLVDTRLLVQANSGGGKSWCLRRLLEQTHGQVQHLVIDPEGEFASLREKYDYVLAAHHGGDTAADPRTAALLAERLLELGASAILDLYELKVHDRVRFVRLFLEALVNAPKTLWRPALVVVDEAHVYCPQQGEAESAGAVIDLASRGRKRGFCAVLATQRLSKLHKDAAAELNNKLIGRTGLDVDVKRAADELGFAKERWRELRELEAGEFFLFGPALSREVRKARIGPVVTSHPKAGARLAGIAPPPTAKIKALLPKLSDLPAEAERKVKTEADLRRRIQDLERQVREKGTHNMPPQVPKRVEVPVLKDAQAKRLEAAVERLDSVVSKAAGEAADAAAEIRTALLFARREGEPAPRAATMPEWRAYGAVRREDGTTQRVPVVGASPGRRSPKERILDALAFLEQIGIAGADKTQVAFLADASPSSSSYANNLGALRTEGLVEYPSAGRVCLTHEGRRQAIPGAAPKTVAELHGLVRAKLSGPQWRILEALIGVYPASLTKDQVADMAGASPVSSSYANNLGALRSLGLIDYPQPGSVVALPVLFLEGRR